MYIYIYIYIHTYKYFVYICLAGVAPLTRLLWRASREALGPHADISGEVWV